MQSNVEQHINRAPAPMFLLHMLPTLQISNICSSLNATWVVPAHLDGGFCYGRSYSRSCSFLLALASRLPQQPQHPSTWVPPPTTSTQHPHHAVPASHLSDLRAPLCWRRPADSAAPHFPLPSAPVLALSSVLTPCTLPHSAAVRVPDGVRTAPRR